MRTSSRLNALVLWSAMMVTPSIVPAAEDTVYIVADDFGSLGRRFRETDSTRADRKTIIEHLLAGEYRAPARVVAFNTRERWALDVSEEIASELQRRVDFEDRTRRNAHRVRRVSHAAASDLNHQGGSPDGGQVEEARQA
jgi:hypothetical protein